MPIRFVAANSSLGNIGVTADDATSSISGTLTAPATATGTVGAAVAEVTADIDGQYTASSNYTGTIGVTLDDTTSAISSEATDPPADALTSGIFVDPTNGSDAYTGLSATYTGGSTGPKASISAGIAACSAGDSLYLLNFNTYSFTTYDLDWNAGASAAQAAEFAGCYTVGGFAYRWTEESGEPRPVVNFRLRSTNDNFTIHGLEINNTSWALRATNVNNFTFQWNEVNRSGSDTSDCLLFSGTDGSKGLWILDNEFTWAESGLDWSGGNDMVSINTYYDYVEVGRNTFTRAPHDLLGIASSNHYVHDNTFSNVDSSENEGYRCASFFTNRAASGSADGGPPYGHGLVENNTFLSSNAPSAGENIAHTIKMQQLGTIYRLNSFRLNTSGGFTQNEVWQIQTCCNDDVSTAPLVADQRIYNNYVYAEACRRWAGRIRTSQTDGTLGSENTRTELHDNHIFNNHFDGVITDLNEAMFEFHEIGASYRVGNTISQNKVEYNSFSDSKTDEFLQDATNGVQTLAQAESNWPGYVNNNTTSSSGGAGLGRDLTTTVGTGNSTTLAVDDAGVFQPRIYDADVGEIYAGDSITVNGQTATVTDRDLSANTLTVTPAVTWTNGQAVNLSGYATGHTGIPSEPSAVDVLWALDPTVSGFNTSTFTTGEGSRFTASTETDATINDTVVRFTILPSFTENSVGWFSMGDGLNWSSLFTDRINIRLLFKIEQMPTGAFLWKFPDIRGGGSGTGSSRIVPIMLADDQSNQYSLGWTWVPSIAGAGRGYPHEIGPNQGEILAPSGPDIDYQIPFPADTWYWAELQYLDTGQVKMWLTPWDGSGTEYSEASPTHISTTGFHNTNLNAIFTAGTYCLWGYRNPQPANNEIFLFGPGGQAIHNDFIGPNPVTSQITY